MAHRAMRERLVLQTPDPQTVSVTSLTRTSTTATVTAAVPHGYATGDYVTIAGASPTDYNGRVKITVTAATTFTYTVSASLPSPAAGTITAVYASDAQGGRRIGWTTVESIWAELVPLRAAERLQAQAIGSQVAYRFRTRIRSDVTPAMRALWTPTWPPGAVRKTLEIHGVLPIDDGLTDAFLECGEVA